MKMMVQMFGMNPGFEWFTRTFYSMDGQVVLDAWQLRGCYAYDRLQKIFKNGCIKLDYTEDAAALQYSGLLPALKFSVEGLQVLLGAQLLVPLNGRHYELKIEDLIFRLVVSQVPDTTA